MKNITKSFGVGIVTFSLLASPAYAKLGATIDSATDINGSVNGVVDTNINTGANINAGINVGLDTSADVEVNARGGMEVDDSDSNTNNTVEENTGATLKVNAIGIAITSSDQVRSEEDLEVFSSNVASKNKAVVRVNIGSGNGKEVRVVYRHKGKFLGFIPITITSTTVVNALANEEAEVKSNLSWWSFLVTGENYNRAILESRIKNNAIIQAHAKADVSAQAKAQIAEAVIAELQANAVAQASADVR